MEIYPHGLILASRSERRETRDVIMHDYVDINKLTFCQSATWNATKKHILWKVSGWHDLNALFLGRLELTSQ